MTITTIISALVSIIGTWKTPNNLENDLSDAVHALGTVSQVEPGIPFVGAALKFVNQAQAGVHNLETGQAATVATKDGYTLVLLKNGGQAAQALGL